MACELLACCQFFNDNMKNLPKTAEYIKEKLCFADFASCIRFRIYKEFDGVNIPPGLDPLDVEEVEKVIACLRKKQESEGKAS
ncbi:MAG: hypothetical protein CXR31_04050 [Geobacter sp.]|nr:MAG: hypothetical protein CXR31_04050 [Geobacter sp.]